MARAPRSAQRDSRLVLAVRTRRKPQTCGVRVFAAGGTQPRCMPSAEMRRRPCGSVCLYENYSIRCSVARVWQSRGRVKI